jgi:hypothetical protein
MRLRVGMVDYSDGRVEIEDYEAVDITYDTTSDVTLQPALVLNLQGLPMGTFNGTLFGEYTMAGDLEGAVNLNLTMTGQMEDDGTGTVVRAAGTTTVTGTATSSAGEYAVNLTL